MKIAPDLFFYPWENYTQNNCNSIMIGGPVKVLIDPGHKRPFPYLERAMTADGFAMDDIGMVLFTHCHPDHMEAGPDLAQLGARLALHPEDEAYLKKIGPAFFQSMGLPMPEVKIDLHLREGDLTVGGKTFQVYHTPGHSPGSICLYWPEIKALITGDLIFAQGVGRTDFPGGSGRKLKESIERMSGLEIDIILPGHGPAIIGRPNVAQNFKTIREMYFPML
jgi:glyoxylase-like metal-dependent hydrolase (beta-lactamase superfamily II)